MLARQRLQQAYRGLSTYSRAVVNTAYQPSPRHSNVPQGAHIGGDPSDDGASEDLQPVCMLTASDPGLSHINKEELLARHSREWSDQELLESHEKHAVFGWGVGYHRAVLQL